MKYVLTMPVYNEAEGILSFLSEIEESCGSRLAKVIVINDRSTDDTLVQLKLFAEKTFLSLEIVTLASNVGHGPATLEGLNRAVGYGLPVFAIDGDGQFLGVDMASAMGAFESSELPVLEGVRIDRDEPFFRKLTSFATRLLVLFRTGKLPKDANTPLRIYEESILMSLLSSMPDQALTPNLLFSSLLRKRLVGINEFQIRFFPRRGSNPSGTMWASRKINLPNKRFLKFCVNASREWIVFRKIS